MQYLKQIVYKYNKCILTYGTLLCIFRAVCDSNLAISILICEESTDEMPTVLRSFNQKL